MLRKLFLQLLVPVLLLPACSPEELPAPAHQPGTSVSSATDMGPGYEYQVFYSLDENAVISRNLKTVWDLGFECTPDGFHVILNGSKSMYAANTGLQDMSRVADTSGFAGNKRLDAPGGSLDSTAIGDWRAATNVFLIDRGATVDGAIGFVKLRVEEADEAGYTISFQHLHESGVRTLRIPKDTNYNFTFLSFDEGGKIVDVAPPKDEWTLCFTQYTAEIPIPYLVTGVLLNPYRTAAVLDSTIGFDAIDLSYAQQKELSENRDVIGYNWKVYDFDAGSYRVNAAMNYIVKVQDGSYYKLHFIDFYNSEGVKGNPQWECSRL